MSNVDASGDNVAVEAVNVHESGESMVAEQPKLAPPSPRSGHRLPLRWKKGQSGNPKGRPKNAGQSIIERMNDLALFDIDRLESIVTNRKSSTIDVAAARRLLATYHDDEQLNREGFKVVADYTNGKPQQTVKVEQVDHRSPDERAASVLESMRRMVGAEQVEPVVPGVPVVVDATHVIDTNGSESD